MRRLHHPHLLPLLDASMEESVGPDGELRRAAHMLFPLYEVRGGGGRVSGSPLAYSVGRSNCIYLPAVAEMGWRGCWICCLEEGLEKKCFLPRTHACVYVHAPPLGGWQLCQRPLQALLLSVAVLAGTQGSPYHVLACATAMPLLCNSCAIPVLCCAGGEPVGPGAQQPAAGHSAATTRAPSHLCAGKHTLPSLPSPTLALALLSLFGKMPCWLLRVPSRVPAHAPALFHPTSGTFPRPYCFWQRA